VINGLEVLVAQGAASFELWTGIPAPVEMMRGAVGLSS
jgi:shikimate 5-dehydrogenase